MPEKQPQYDEALKSLIASTHIVPYDDEVPNKVDAVAGRMANCCGSSFVGVTTWAGMFGYDKIPKGELATWNTEKIIVAGFVEPDELPTLKVGRHFLRMKGNKKDFFVTWENV